MEGRGEPRQRGLGGRTAVSGSAIGPVTDDPPLGLAGDAGAPAGGGDEPAAGGRVVAVVTGARMMKHAGPAFRWLAWAAVGLRVVLA